MNKLSRRDFLKGMGGLAGAVLLDACGGKPEQPKSSPIIQTPQGPMIPTPVDYGKWVFMNNLEKSYTYTVPQIKKLIKLGPDEEALSKDIALFSEQRSFDTRDFFAAGFRDKVDIKFDTVQLYARAADSESTAATLDYSKISLENLDEKVQGLTHGKLEFVPLKSDVTTHDLANNRVFIGEHYINVFEITVSDPHGKVERYSIPLSPQFSCFGETDFRTDTRYAFISANKLALLGITSEIIPFTTSYSSRSAFSNLSDVMTAEETISEGISFTLTRDLVEQLNIPGARKFLDEVLDSFPKFSIAYRHVKSSIDWIQKNGVQAAFDMYMEDPKKYMKAIGAKDFSNG